MTDTEIIQLYWQRDECAVSETDTAYGAYCRTIAGNILQCDEDTEESVNDTYLAVWNSLPPDWPNCLKAYLGCLCRRISISAYRRGTAKKRGGCQSEIAIEELSAYLPDKGNSPEAPELKAQQEWGQYTADYLASKENDEEWHEYYSSSVESWAKEQGDIAGIYRLLDDEMLAELKRIADEYDLKLHDSEEMCIVNSAELLEPAWISKFQPETDMYEYIGIYEDKSFYMHAYADCTTYAERSDYTTSYYVILCRKGTVPPPTALEESANKYAERTEWSYTTSRGEELSLTHIPDYNGWSSLYISYTYDDGYLLIDAGFYDVQDLSQLEAFAERFDYSAIG